MSLLNSRQENLEALALLPCLDRFQLLWSLSVILSSFRLPWPPTARLDAPASFPDPAILGLWTKCHVPRNPRLEGRTT
jgi:hypothetical protein